MATVTATKTIVDQSLENVERVMSVLKNSTRSDGLTRYFPGTLAATKTYLVDLARGFSFLSDPLPYNMLECWGQGYADGREAALKEARQAVAVL